MRLFIKPVIKLSAILGAVLGLISLIPFINGFSCFILFNFVGAGIIYYLKKNEFIGVISLQDGALIGAISGFVGFIAAAVVYMPISYVLGMIFSPLAKTGFNLSNSFIVASYSFFIILMLVFFIAILSALFNAFSGMITAYIYEKLESNIVSNPEEFIIEQ